MVPVLTVQGGKDSLFPPPDVESRSALYVGSKKVTYVDLPQSGHALTLESEHGRLESATAKFLSQNEL